VIIPHGIVRIDRGRFETDIKTGIFRMLRVETDLCCKTSERSRDIESKVLMVNCTVDPSVTG